MIALFLCSSLFLVLVTATLIVAFSDTVHPVLASVPMAIATSFILSALLGFTLANELLQIRHPIELTVAGMLSGAVIINRIQQVAVPKKTSLADIVPVLIGVALFVAARSIMHALGLNIVDQFEVFLD
ncbi:MAG: hypothetical protein N3B18_10920 [Desulfobacterota bacterium]|nr:hypothetical protein [Thermodesulfobacteriota bacterium]